QISRPAVSLAHQRDQPPSLGGLEPVPVLPREQDDLASHHQAGERYGLGEFGELDRHRDRVWDYPAPMPLTFAERPARAAEPAGLLVLHHGRGSDEQDLIGLAPVLDPEERLHVVAPRAPLQLRGSPGYHWYLVPRVGYPDPDSFRAADRELAVLHDELWERTGIGPDRTVLG